MATTTKILGPCGRAFNVGTEVLLVGGVTGTIVSLRDGVVWVDLTDPGLPDHPDARGVITADPALIRPVHCDACRSVLGR